MKSIGLKHLKFYFKNHLKYDFSASVVVFLVAIPLCLGVALSSGAPIYAGLISGIVGGIIVGLLSQSNLSVSGPSPAIASIMVFTLEYLQNYEAVLCAIFLSGLLQLFLGYRKFGFFADYIPNNVIQGMLSAIGILLILKQIPMAFTLSKSFVNLKELLVDSSESLNFHPLIDLTFHINSGACILSILSLSLLFFGKNQVSSP